MARSLFYSRIQTIVLIELKLTLNFKCTDLPLVGGDLFCSPLDARSLQRTGIQQLIAFWFYSLGGNI